MGPAPRARRRDRLAGDAAPGHAEVRAATPDLTIVANARYDVEPGRAARPGDGRPVFTNHLKDTATKRYYFDRAFLAVLPGSLRVQADLKGLVRLKVVTSKKTSTSRSSGSTSGDGCTAARPRQYQLVFDLVDKGGAASREVRVGDSLVAFPVWAFATDSTPGSTVRVAFPAGYHVEVESGDIPAPSTTPTGRHAPDRPSSTSHSRSSPISSPTGPAPYPEPHGHDDIGDEPST